MSYGAIPPTPEGYRAPSFPPPTPILHHPFHHGSWRQPRTSQACDRCRQRKTRCDGTKPCKTCKDAGTECRYRVPKPTDKAQAGILEGITVMQNTLAALSGHFGQMNDRLTKMETVVSKSAVPGQIEPDPGPNEQYGAAPHSPFATDSDASRGYYSSGTPRDHGVTTTEQMPVRMMAEDDVEAEPGPLVPPGEPAIPNNHTTRAGLLLDWPGIKELTEHHVKQLNVRFIGEFPISQEQNRGHLVVYGQGEDSHASRYAKDILDHGSLEMADESDMASPSPAADYGQLGGRSPSDQAGYRGGVLDFDGNPDFTHAKVWSYVESFKANILNMHPIIQPKALDYWVRHFLESLPSVFAVGGGGQTQKEVTGSKRKRSSGPDEAEEPQTPGQGRPGKPTRSIHSALVLTILALGKVCLARTKIPDVLHPTDALPHGSPSSPSQGSPQGFSAHSQYSGFLSPGEQDRGHQSRRSSIHAPGGVRTGYNLKKNYEVIPGLEYFAFATDILGNHTGAYGNMKNVYANIFAGIYHGQLGRPMESFAFIHQASHKLQVIMRPSLDRMRKIKRNSELIQNTTYNQLALTFWTCLQLESDLIAELQLPPSGLLSYEDDMPHPNMSLLEGFDQRVLDSYPGQLYLRTHLNSIHRMFYAPEDPIKAEKDKFVNGKDKRKKIDETFKNAGLVSDAVSGMHWVAPSFAFKEADAPADDILGARLRAKYWGAQVITYRPFIRQILLFSQSIKHHPSSPNLTVTSEFREDIIAPVIHPNTKTPSEIDPQVKQLAEKGIKALIESTRAFHGLGELRPIITNVFGTAHAQWGNLLVLSAAFRDDVLTGSVDEDLLRSLFHKTIQFLRQSATGTSALQIDRHILEGLQKDLFYTSGPRTSSSFSSSASLRTQEISMAAHEQTPDVSSPPVRGNKDSDKSTSKQAFVSSPEHGIEEECVDEQTARESKPPKCPEGTSHHFECAVRDIIRHYVPSENTKRSCTKCLTNFSKNILITQPHLNMHAETQPYRCAKNGCKKLMQGRDEVLKHEREKHHVLRAYSYWVKMGQREIMECRYCCVETTLDNYRRGRC